jgi:hypothetical protein
MFTSLPNGSRTKKRRTPHGSIAGPYSMEIWALFHPGENRLEIIDFDREVWHRGARPALRHEGHLGGHLLVRAERHYPSHVHQNVQPENTLVERLCCGGVRGRNIRDDPFHLIDASLRLAP